MTRRHTLLLAITCLFAIIFDSRVSRVPTTAHESITIADPIKLPPQLSADDQLRVLARQAYVWGWPMVYVHNCREAVRKVPAPGKSGGMPVAPINQLSMLTDYISPKQTLVPCPNQDVVYGLGMFDLSLEPVVVQVPDFGDRFWLYQLGDQRTDGFADCGKIYGTKPGCYLVVGPTWNGDVPSGIAGVFRSPTPTAYCIPRVFQDDTAEDRAAVQTVLNGIMAYPLSKFTGAARTTNWLKSKWLPSVMTGDRAKRVVPERFFDDLAKVLECVPPRAGEEAFYGEVREMLAKAEKDARVKTLLVAAALQTENEIVNPLFQFRNFGTKLPANWTTVNNGAAFGDDYLTRTAVAKSNVFVNRNHETKYFYQDLDSTSLRLSGNRSYRITFAKGQLPPTTGFWSLTLYNDAHGFHPNNLNRYSIGTKSRQLQYNADGSLTIIVQAAAPSAAEEANWLPTPAGEFSLYLRAYGPDVAITSGQWTPPAVEATDLVQVASK
jgi:hypothetical protein